MNALHRRQFIKQLGLSAASLPFLIGLPSLGLASPARPRQRLIIMFSPNGTIPPAFWPEEEGEDFKLKEIMESDFLETYVISAQDRFGKYGTVGFAVVDKREPRLLDLMFSCRIQSKRVEHAVLCFMLERFDHRDFHANYLKTQKNAPGGKVFDEVGFECGEEKDGLRSLVFKSGQKIPHDGIITIKELLAAK